jgi:hypothetical protein
MNVRFRAKFVLLPNRWLLKGLGVAPLRPSAFVRKGLAGCVPIGAALTGSGDFPAGPHERRGSLARRRGGMPPGPIRAYLASIPNHDRGRRRYAEQQNVSRSEGLIHAGTLSSPRLSLSMVRFRAQL